MPPDFPVNILPAMRALTVIADTYPHQLEAIVAAIYEKSFVNRQPVHTLEAVKSTLGTFLEKETVEEIVLKATSPEVKQKLTQNTEEAIDSGAFGLPWFKATNSKGDVEYFWGFDHLGQVCDHLGLEKPQSGNGGEGGWRLML